MKNHRNQLAILVLLIPLLNAAAQESNRTRYIPLPGSKLWIEGSSTVNTFSCGTGSVIGFGSVAASTNIAQRPSRQESEVEVSIPVGTLDCDNSRMNADLRGAMKAEAFPLIRYSLVETVFAGNLGEKSATVVFRTIGTLSIAGRSKRVEIPVVAQQLSNGTYRITGSNELSMLEFGITPPTAFFGLIRAHDRLVVHFDILAGQADRDETNVKEVFAK